MTASFVESTSSLSRISDSILSRSSSSPSEGSSVQDAFETAMTNSSSLSSSKKSLFSKRDGGSRKFDRAGSSAKPADRPWRLPSTPPKNGYGTLTDSNGNCYKGHFVNGLKSGHGILTFANGNVYEGDFRKNQRWGIGTLKYANGDKYHGDFVDDRRTGHGKFTWAEGDVYEGDFVDGNRTGHGKFTWVNGDVYEGTFVDGKRTGRGIFIWVNGDVYEGDFVDEKRTGRGKIIWANGDIYEGDFIDGERTGRGTYTWVNGDVYEGTFVDGKIEGRGKLTDFNGVCYEGNFHNNFFQGDISNLGDLTFLQLICGIPFPDEGVKLEYALTIMADFLIANGYSELGEALKSANKTYQNGKTSLNDVYGKIKNKQTQLLVYGCSYHVMGLNINCNPSDNAQFEIFNSEAGALEELHEKNGSKYSTMLVEKIPIKNITRRKVSEILDCGNFEHAGSAYGTIKSIPGAKTIHTADLPSPAWQTPQKESANNCTLEWINAFLRNKMTKSEYDGMRLKLFGVCLDQAKKKEKNDELDECIGILEKKKEKRVKRLQESSAQAVPANARKRKWELPKNRVLKN